MRRGTSKADIKWRLEKWIYLVGPNSGSLVSYGYKRIRVPSRKVALAKWKVALAKWKVLCKKREKIDEACETMKAILLVLNR